MASAIWHAFPLLLSFSNMHITFLHLDAYYYFHDVDFYFFILHWLIIVHLKCRCPHFPWQRRGDACGAQACDRAEPPNDDEHMAKGFGRHKRSPSVLQPHLPLHHRGAERNDPFVLNLQLLPPLVVVDLIMPLILSCLVTLTWLQLTAKSLMAISFRGAYESFLFSLSFKNSWRALSCLNAC